MNIRQQKYKKNRLLGMNQYNAARAAGYSQNYAKIANSRVEKYIKDSLADELEQQGFTDKKIVAYALDVMQNATKLSGKDAVEHPDWQARIKMFEIICKLTGKINDNPPAGGTTINVYPNRTFIYTDIEGSIAEQPIAGGLLPAPSAEDNQHTQPLQSI